MTNCIKFKEGDIVKLIRHRYDSKENLEIGFKGRVATVDGGSRQILVNWQSWKECPSWWVDITTIASCKPAQFENK